MKFLIDAKGDVPWLKMSFGKTAAYGECFGLPILKKISAVSVYQFCCISITRELIRVFFFCERDL